MLNPPPRTKVKIQRCQMLNVRLQTTGLFTRYLYFNIAR